jgi:hypothetical protein
MRIKEIMWQDRKEFGVILECEYCKDTYSVRGYDDDRFRNEIVPDLPCRICCKKTGEYSDTTLRICEINEAIL